MLVFNFVTYVKNRKIGSTYPSIDSKPDSKAKRVLEKFCASLRRKCAAVMDSMPFIRPRSSTGLVNIIELQGRFIAKEFFFSFFDDVHWPSIRLHSILLRFSNINGITVDIPRNLFVYCTYTESKWMNGRRIHYHLIDEFSMNSIFEEAIKAVVSNTFWNWFFVRWFHVKICWLFVINSFVCEKPSIPINLDTHTHFDERQEDTENSIFVTIF